MPEDIWAGPGPIALNSFLFGTGSSSFQLSLKRTAAGGNVKLRENILFNENKESFRHGRKKWSCEIHRFKY